MQGTSLEKYSTMHRLPTWILARFSGKIESGMEELSHSARLYSLLILLNAAEPSTSL